MVEVVKLQRHYKDNLSHAEIMALMQAYGQIKKLLQGRLKSTLSNRNRKGMECCDGRGQRSIDDVAECGGPKKTGNEQIVLFSVDKYLNKSKLKNA